MTEPMMTYTPEELIAIIRLVNISKIFLRAERFDSDPVNGAQFTAETGYAIGLNSITFKVGYKLRLLTLGSGAVADGAGSGGVLEVTVLVTYEVVDPPRPGWENSAMHIGGIAFMTAHPYLRESVTSLAASLNYPAVSLGLLRSGAMTPESVAVADQIYQFDAPLKEDIS